MSWWDRIDNFENLERLLFFLVGFFIGSLVTAFIIY